MKFGVREICNVVFRATTTQKIGNRTFKKGQPVFYLDSAKTSSVEGAATTVYAQGGRGNARLIAWEGERTLTFTVEDALISPISFSMLSGAGVIKGKGEEEVHFHQTTTALADASTGIIDLTNALELDESIDPTAPLYIMKVDNGGDLTGEIVEGEFKLVKSGDGHVSGKQLIYGDATDLANFTSLNQGRQAYVYPATIDLPTAEQVTGWKENVDVTSPTRLAAPVPRTVLVQSSVNPNELSTLVININASNPSTAPKVPLNPLTGVTEARKWYYISSAKRTVIDEDGTETVLPLPAYFKNPVLKGSDMIYTSSGVDSMPYRLRKPNNAEWFANSSTSTYNFTASANKYYKVTAYKSGSEYVESIQDEAYKTVTRGIIKIRECLADGTLLTEGNDNDTTEYTIHLTGQMKQAIINRYFGLTSTTKDYPAYAVPATSTVNADLNAKFFGTATVASTAKETEAYDKAVELFNAAYSATLAKTAFDETAGQPLLIDYYVIKKSASVTELQIDAENFAGYYYVEADTLFRRQIDGKDLPANLTFPNVKIQSNFTFSMASSGDPSTFTFTMDAFPGYTYFNKEKKVLCAIQIVDDKTASSEYRRTVFPHKTGVLLEASMNDSSPEVYDEYDHSNRGYQEFVPEVEP